MGAGEGRYGGACTAAAFLENFIGSEPSKNAREAAPAITAYAEQNGYTHIVMGTGDKKGLKRLVLGSVAAEVVSHAHCTVTVAR